MRPLVLRRVFILLAPIAVAMAGPSSAGDPITDCNSDDPKLRLQGCTAVIDSGKHTGVDLAIAYSLRSDGRMVSRDFDGAIQDLAKAAELEPAKRDEYNKRLAEVYRQRGDARKKANNLDGAIADYSETIKTDPTRREALLGRSDVYVLKKDYDKAIADLTAALENQPATEDQKARLGKLYERRGIERLLKSDADGAIADYTEAIRLDGANAALYLARAETYKRKKDWDLALEDYNQVIRAKPGLADAYLGRSDLYRQKGENGRAIDDLTEVIKQQPKNTDALLRRGLAHEENKQPDKALADYRAALRIDRSHKLAKENIKRVMEYPALSPTVIHVALRPVGGQKERGDIVIKYSDGRTVPLTRNGMAGKLKLAGDGHTIGYVEHAWYWDPYQSQRFLVDKKIVIFRDEKRIATLNPEFGVEVDWHFRDGANQVAVASQAMHGAPSLQLFDTTSGKVLESVDYYDGVPLPSWAEGLHLSGGP